MFKKSEWERRPSIDYNDGLKIKSGDTNYALKERRIMKYKVGDLVTIRSWEAMKREFGLRGNMIIDTPYGFTPLMRKYCGRQMKIIKVDKTSYLLEDGEHLSFTDDMIAHNFTYGEEIAVSNDKRSWCERIFTGYIDGAHNPYVCCSDAYKVSFKKGSNFCTRHWKYARKIEKTPSIEIICRSNGKEIPLSLISEETLINIRNNSK